MRTSGPNLDRTSNLFIGALFGCVVVISMFSSLFGTQAVMIMDYYGISAVQYGTLTTLINLAGLAAGMVVMFIGDRINKIAVFCTTFALLITGLFVFSLAIPFAFMPALCFASGFVFTMTDVLTAATILEVFAKHKEILYPRLCSFYDLGSITGPLFVTLLVLPAVSKTFTAPFFWLSCIGAAVLVILAIFGRKIMPRTPYAVKKEKCTLKRKGIDVFKKRNAWIILLSGCLIFMLYTGIVTWMPAYANLEMGISFEISGILVTLCFAASFSARMLSAGIYKKLSPKQSTQLFGLIAAICIFVIGLLHHPMLAIVLIIIGGGSMGIAISSVVLFLSDNFPSHPSSVAVISLLMFNVGGTVTPVFMSEIAYRTSFGMAFIFISFFCIAGLLLLNLVKKTDAAQSAGEI